jgi:methylated-DNA-[protein]-cysteine S-methyltransferase
VKNEKPVLLNVNLGSLGHAWIHWTPGVGLKRLEWRAGDAETSEQGTKKLDPALRELALRLEAFARGEEADLSRVPLDLSEVSDFYAQVYRRLQKFRRGETCSYGELARKLGRPGAARAVGHAMKKNPFPLVVPCHRVLPSGGSLGEFSAPGGTHTKAVLLKMEGTLLS